MTQPTKPSLLNRFRKNWPLCIVGVALISTLVITRLQAVNPVVCNPEAGTTIAYWSFILQCSAYLNPALLIIFLAALTMILIVPVFLRAICRGEYPPGYQLRAILVLLVVNMWGCYLCGQTTVWTGNEYKHINSMTFSDHTYHLALKQAYTSGMGSTGQYQVYECDPAGQECTLKEIVDQNGVPTPYPAVLVVSNNQLFIQVDGEQKLIAVLSS
jgi:hypothetical protein